MFSFKQHHSIYIEEGVAIGEKIAEPNNSVPVLECNCLEL